MSYADSQLHLIGANFFYMQAKAFGIYQNATGAVLSNGFLNMTQDQFSKLQSIFITISGVCILIHGSFTGSLQSYSSLSFF